MSRLLNRGTQLLIDLVALSLAYWLAFLFRFEFQVQLDTAKLLFFTWPYVIVLQYVVMTLAGVTSVSWRHVGLRDVQRIAWSLAGPTAILVVLRLTVVHIGGYGKFVIIPLGVLAMDFVLAAAGVTGVRVLRRMLAERHERRGKNARKTKKTLLIGAGRGGALVAQELLQRPDVGLQPLGFLDDDAKRIGTLIHGLKVHGDTYSLREVADRLGAEQVLVTMASAPRDAVRRIVELCEQVGLPLKIVPGYYEVLDGRVNLSKIRNVTVEDLLGRDAIELDQTEIGEFLTGKTVVVTGAGGSIGSELCRLVARFRPSRLVLFERAEPALFQIEQELRRTLPDLELSPVVGDVCDAARVDGVFAEHTPDVVLHAAAHKHVPLMEANPGEAIKNNIGGTRTVADAAARHGVRSFVLISTDKAVNPTSVMGATKRLAEQYTQSLAETCDTRFTAVRFGNVLGSAGSVIPIFKAQIQRGGPVTVTHPEMTRYFMTIPEACQLVVQAAAMSEGSEIYVLDMGKPVKIVDLARDLIRLSGLTETDVEIRFTGVRPGEKLFEELSVNGENLSKTRHSKIYIGTFPRLPHEQVLSVTDRLLARADRATPAQLRRMLTGAVPEMLEPATDPPPPAASVTVH